VFGLKTIETFVKRCSPASLTALPESIDPGEIIRSADLGDGQPFFRPYLQTEKGGNCASGDINLRITAILDSIDRA